MSRERLDTRLILDLLAGGGYVAGSAIARATGTSRSAVWKRISGLRQMGLDVRAVRGKGYRLAQPLELLDREHIAAQLDPDVRARLRRLDVALCLESTNAALMAQPAPRPGEVFVSLAEYQTGGRGRRGRAWIAPLGGSLCLSLAWCFERRPPQFGALGLAAGVGVARALTRLGCASPGLKWPNDVVAGGAKLGGILIELSGEIEGPSHVVLGVGLNVHLPRRVRDALARERAVTDLRALGLAAGRNALAAAVISALTELLAGFERHGFSACRAEWEKLDVLAGHEVRVTNGSAVHTGTASGVDGEGALRVSTPSGELRFHAGEATLRT